MGKHWKSIATGPKESLDNSIMKTKQSGGRSMVSRLLLVGMVATLGVTLPSRSECEGWFSSVQSWASAQLADWDAWQPREGDPCPVAETPIRITFEAIPQPSDPRVIADGSQETAGATLNRSSALIRKEGARRLSGDGSMSGRPSPQIEPIALEPIAVAEDADTGVADQLNRESERLEIGQTRAGRTEVRVDSATVMPSAHPELRLLTELCLIVEKAGDAEKLIHPEVHSPRVIRPSVPEDAVFERITNRLELFSEDLAASPPANSLPVGSRVTFDPIELPADLGIGIADELNRFAEGLAANANGPASKPAQAPQFEPIDVDEDLDSGTAYALNRASEGLGGITTAAEGLAHGEPQIRRNQQGSAFTSRPYLPASRKLASAAHVQEKSPSHPELPLDPGAADSGLREAVRLTRDAMCAWMNVMKGSTRVDMTAR
jgi:hypothetical protein